MIEDEALQRLDGRHQHPQQVVGVAGHQVALHHLRTLGDRLLETLLRVSHLLLQADVDEHVDVQDRTFWQVALFVGPLATAFCFCAVNAASMWLSTASMSSAMFGVPVVGLIMAVIFLGESLSLTLVTGVLAIVGGILLVTVAPRADSTR